MNAAAKKHFFNPHNVGDAGEPRFEGRAASLTCGAHLKLSIQVDEQQTVSEAKFRAAGCNVLIAAASVLTDQVLGLTTAEAAVLGQNAHALADQLGRVESVRCVGMACDALVDAVRAFSDAARDDWAGDEALICTCFFVSERTIENEIRSRGLTTVSEVTNVCNAGGGCGSCHQLIQEILEME